MLPEDFPVQGSIVSLETVGGDVVRNALVFGFDEHNDMLILKEVGVFTCCVQGMYVYMIELVVGACVF